jgi:hypothetical protein
MLRAIGLIMTDADIVNLEKDVDPENRGEFELGSFFVTAARRFRDQDSVESAAKKAFSKMSKSTLISGMWYNCLRICYVFLNTPSNLYHICVILLMVSNAIVILR